MLSAITSVLIRLRLSWVEHNHFYLCSKHHGYKVFTYLLNQRGSVCVLPIVALKNITKKNQSTLFAMLAMMALSRFLFSVLSASFCWSLVRGCLKLEPNYIVYC